MNLYQAKQDEKNIKGADSRISASSTNAHLEDNRPESVFKKQQMNSMVLQKKENKTGLPDQLKSGIENLSGYSMDNVKVHYNSNKPAQLQAHAYAQGTDIHIGPGQEKHLPHEAWHVVQQKQGRVMPTMKMKSGARVNDDQGLEREADLMGAKTKQLQKKDSFNNHNNKEAAETDVIQRQPKWPVNTRVNVDLNGFKHPDFFGIRSGTIVRYVTDRSPIIKFDHPLPKGNIQQAFNEDLVTPIEHEEQKPITSTADLVQNALLPDEAEEMLTTPSKPVNPEQFGGRPVARGKRDASSTRISEAALGPPPKSLREGFGSICDGALRRPKSPTGKGLVIGEWHGDTSPKRWLIEKFKALHDIGYRVLFMEHLFTDQNAVELDKLAGLHKPTSSSVVKAEAKPSSLEERLKDMNAGYLMGAPEAKHFNYVTVIMEAVRAGIRVIPIDSTRTYWGYNHTKGRNRHYALNYPASLIINYYAEHHLKSNEKWIAFVGVRHMVTQADALKDVEVQKDSPDHPAMGIAELTGGTPVLIESNPKIAKGEIGESTSRLVKKGTDEPDENLSPTTFRRIEMGTRTE